MAIFRKEDEAPGTPSPRPTRAQQPRSAPPAATQTTQVAEGSKLRGEITGSSDLVVGGEVEGKLMVQGSVTVEKSGLVRGEIKAKQVRVGGRVQGNIAGSEMIEILGDGSVQGDVKSPRVVIADGAFFKGKVEMGGDQS